MYKNDVTRSPGQITIDTLLICNTFNTGSAICPFDSIPTSTDMNVYPLVQVCDHFISLYYTHNVVTLHYINRTLSKGISCEHSLTSTFTCSSRWCPALQSSRDRHQLSKPLLQHPQLPPWVLTRLLLL